MAVDFLEYNSCVWSPIVIGNTVVKRASEFKLLGIVISHDLTWDVRSYTQESQQKATCASPT